MFDLTGDGYTARSLKTGGLLIDAVGTQSDFDPADVEAQGFEFVRFYVNQSGKDLETITELA